MHKDWPTTTAALGGKWLKKKADQTFMKVGGMTFEHKPGAPSITALCTCGHSCLTGGLVLKYDEVNECAGCGKKWAIGFTSREKYDDFHRNEVHVWNQTRRALVKHRRGGDWDVKPEAECMDGAIIDVYEGWEITPDDSSIYVGETAWLLSDPLEWPLKWLASGDLVFLDGGGHE